MTQPTGYDVGTDALHIYVSTACVHGKHDHCRRYCKWCQAECRCPCHEIDQPSPAPLEGRS